jgi:hypothetical protein
MRAYRSFIVALLAGYLVAGLSLGTAMQSAIPAMSGLGVAYYAATWPAWIAAGITHSPRPLPIPAWCFDFKEARP